MGIHFRLYLSRFGKTALLAVEPSVLETRSAPGTLHSRFQDNGTYI